MNIKIAYTDTGPIMGDFNETLNGDYTVENPVILQVGPQQIGIVPLLGFVKAKSITLKKSDIKYGDIFDPQDDLRNHYSGQFGSGIQLATSPASISKK